MLQRLQLAALGTLLALLALIVVTEIWLFGAPVSRLWLILTVLPLLLALHGFLHGRRYTFQWMSLVIWLYFAAGVVRLWVATTSSARLYGMLETLFSLLLFGLCCAVARYSSGAQQK